jgi:hypothetical protein
MRMLILMRPSAGLAIIVQTKLCYMVVSMRRHGIEEYTYYETVMPDRLV